MLSLIGMVVLLAACPLVIRSRLGTGWLWRPGTLFVLMAILYHGVSQVLLAFPAVNRWATLRRMSAGDSIGAVEVGVAVALLVFTIGYATTAQPTPPSGASAPTAAVRGVPWWLVAVAFTPLFLATISGRGYRSGTAIDASSSSPVTLLSSQFYVVLLILTTFSVVVRWPRLFLPALVGQTFLLAIAGQRLEILVGVAVLGVLLSRVGRMPSTRQFWAAGAVGLLFIFALTGVRASSGRDLFYSDAGLGARGGAFLDVITGQVTTEPDPNEPPLLAQAALRLDGNVMAAQAHASGRRSLGWSAIVPTVADGVPSAIYTSKTSRPATERNAIAATVGLLGAQRKGYVPGFLGMYVGFVGLWGVAVLAGLFGLLLGYGERWIFDRVTAPRIVVLAVLAESVMFYERGFPSLVIFMRGAVPLALAAWALQRLATSRSVGRDHHQGYRRSV